MNCKKCKKEIPSDSKFCNYCGAKQKREQKGKRADGRLQKQITITANGQKKQKCFYGKSMAEINQKILEYKGEVEKGRTFGVVADEWWEVHEPTLTYNSRCGYIAGLKCAKEYFKDTYIKDVKARDVNNYVNSFAAKGFSQKTTLTKLQIVRQVLAYAVLNDEVEHNHALDVELPKKLAKTKRTPPNDSELKIVKESVEKPFGLFAYFCLYTGCRRGEALAIQGKDIDLENNIIHIRKSVYTKNSKAYIKKPKTDAGVREVPLLEQLKAVLPLLEADEYLFACKNSPMSNRWFSENWKEYCESAGIKITPHQLRHAYATRIYELGIDEKSAQELMGHSDIITTRNVYTHISDEKRKTTAKMLADF